MGRSEQRMRERRAAEERRANPRTPAPATPKPDNSGARRGRGAGLDSRRGNANAFIQGLGARPIATPGGGGSNDRPTRRGGGLNTGTGSRTAPAPSTPTPRPAGIGNLPSDYKETELEAGRTAEAHRPGAGFTPSGRGETRTSPTGVQQKGTDMSMANQMLQNLGITSVQYGQFESNKLPAGESPVKTEGKTDTGATMGGKTANQAANDGSAGDNSLQAPIPETNIAGIGTGERYRREFMNSGRNVMGGLRAAEASKGLLYASGKHWREDGNGGFTEISKEEFTNIKRGNLHAQEFANSKLSDLTATQSNTSNTYTVDPEATPTIGREVEYTQPDDADYPSPTEVAPMNLTSAEMPTDNSAKRKEMYATALQRRQGK